MASPYRAVFASAGVLALILFAGCSGEEEDFGPTVIRSRIPDKDPPSAEASESSPTEPDSGIADASPREMQAPAAQAQNPGSGNANDIPPSNSTPPDSGEQQTAVAKTAPPNDDSNTKSEIRPINEEDKAAPVEVAQIPMHDGPKIDRIPTAGTLAQSSGSVAVFAGSEEPRLTIFNQYTGEAVSSFEYPGKDSVTSIATNVEGNLVIAGLSDGSVRAFRAVDTSSYDEYA